MTSASTGGGRRVAGRPPREGARPDRGAVTALVLLAVAGVALALTGGEPAADVAGGTEGALVDRTQLSCPATTLPDMSGAGVRARAVAGLLATDDEGAPLGDSGSVGSALVGDEPEDIDLPRGAVSPLPSGAEGPFVDAEGEAAAGLFGFRSDESSTARAVSACAAPRSSWWFTGLGADLDHSSQLVLTNLDPGPAVVDLRVFGPEGEIDTIGTRGVTVAPGEATTFSLADVAPQTAEVMVNVQASRGRVAVAASDRYAVGPAAPVGFEWVGDAARPSRTVRLAGVPGAAPTKTLVVGNPSDSEALVEVEVAGSDGSFVPTELEEVSVPPGTVEAVDLADVLPRREAVAVRVRAQVPVTASLRAASRPDTTYANTATPLVGQAAAPVPPRGRTTVHLTAGATDAVARVEGFRADGRSTGDDEVELAATATTTWRPARGTAYIVVTPVDGSVSGAALYDGAAGLATLPLRTVPIRVRLPGVVPGPCPAGHQFCSLVACGASSPPERATTFALRPTFNGNSYPLAFTL